jgi:hypothetical protein
VTSNSLREVQGTDKRVTTISEDRNQVLTVHELAYRLRVAPSWVYAHADALGAFRLEKYLRFDWNRVLGRLATGPIESRTLGSRPNDPRQDQ